MDRGTADFGETQPRNAIAINAYKADKASREIPNDQRTTADRLQINEALYKEARHIIAAAAPYVEREAEYRRAVDANPNTDWQEFGLCNGVESELFYPGRGIATEPAKIVCRACVVRDECLEYALENGEKHGIWGGKSERERRRIRKESALTNDTPSSQEAAS